MPFHGERSVESRDYIHQESSKGETVMSTTSLQQRLNDLFGYIRQGKIIEAMNEFYDKDTVMQDNANPPTKGLATNIEREKQFLNGVKEWKGFNVMASGVGDNVTFYESTMDFIATNGQPVHLEQVAVSKWKNGKIAYERFYYDTERKA
jgi:ketosteroid isomerase-like protein